MNSQQNQPTDNEVRNAAPPPGRQERRTRETRELLMRAAKTVFIRDGYEGTDLKDIADLADRTKGAIYGHFKSKEDIFLALVAEHQQEYRAKLASLIGTDVKQNRAVVRQFLLDLAADDDWALLLLEFKMFTLRHPEAKAKFQALYTPTYEGRPMNFEIMLGSNQKRKDSVDRAVAFVSLLPILSALLLEAKFEPKSLSKTAIRHVIGEVFDCLVQS